MDSSRNYFERQNRRERVGIIITVLAFLVVLSTIAIVIYVQQTRHLENDQKTTLSLIADNKISEIVSWRSERLGDGAVLQRNQPTAVLVKALLEDPQNRSLQQQNLSWMGNLRSAYGYRTFSLYDTNGTEILDDPLIMVPQSSGFAADLSMVVSQNEPELSDLYKDERTGMILMDLYVPIDDPSNPANGAIAVFDLRIDPNQAFYPMILAWPSKSDTGETVLFRSDGKTITYLNALRFNPYSALKLQFPITSPDLPAAIVARSDTNVHEGTDYRGHEVIYAGRQIPGTNWFLLSKMDKSEILAGVKLEGWILMIILVFFCITCAAIAISLLERQRRLYVETIQRLDKDREEIRDRYKLLLETGNDIIVVCNDKGRITDFNDRAVETYGYSMAELSGMSVMDLRVPEDRIPESSFFNTVDKKGFLRFELTHLRRNGQRFPVEASIRKFEIDGEKFYLDIIRDISERRKAQHELEMSEERYRGMIEHATDGIFTADQKGQFVSVNDVGCQILGYSRAEILQKNVFDLISRQSLEAEPTYFWEVAEGLRSYVVTERLVNRKDGSLLPVEISGFRLPDGNVQGIVRDISERVNHRQELEAALVRYQQFFEMNPIPSYVYDTKNAKILAANQAALRYYGYSREEFFELSLDDIHLEILGGDDQVGQNGEKSASRLHKHKKKDGTEVFVEEQSQVIDFDGEPATRILEIDVTEKLKAEMSLKENLSNLQSIIETTPLAMISMDKKGIISLWNKAAEHIFGWTAEEMIGKKSEIFLDSPDDNLETVVKRILDAKNPISYEGIRKTKDGRKINVQVSATAVRDYRDRVKGILGIIADVTDIKANEAAQRALEEDRAVLLNRLQLQFKSMPVGFLLTDENLNILDWNPAAERIFGYSRSEMLGRSSYGTMIPADQEQAVRAVITQTITKNQPLISTNLNITKDGRVITVEWHNTPLRDDSGKLIALMDMAMDVTEKQEAEKKLRESEEKLRALFDSPLIGITITSPDKRIVNSNDAYLNIIGYSREDLDAGEIYWDKLTPPEFLELDYRAIEQAQRTGFCTPYEKQYFRKDGSLIWVLLGFVLFGEEKENAVAFILDINEKKQAEQALRESEFKYSNLFKSMLNGLAYCRMIFDKNGQPVDFIYLMVNNTFESLTGLKNAEGKRITELIPNIREDNPDLFQIYGRVAKTGKPESFETFVPGLGRYYSTHVFSPEKGYFTAIFEDISIRKKAEMEIKALNEGLEVRVSERTSELRQANQEMEAFTYSVSHDLRAPIRAIDGFSQILIEEHQQDISAEMLRYLQLIRKNTRNMGQLIDDLLAFSRLGKLPVQKGRVNVSRIVKEIIPEIKMQNPDRNISFKVERMPQCYADERLLKQVYVNLISNAVKFTRRRQKAVIEIGQCPAKPRMADGTIGNETSSYYVRDNGVGFDMRFYDKLFGVFQRLHNIEDYEGTGVGLAIVKRVIEKHGGLVWADSKLDSGTTFYFTLGEEQNDDKSD